MNDYLRGVDLGGLVRDRDLVQRGVRPVSHRTLQVELVEEARLLLERQDSPGMEQIQYLEYPSGETHVDFYIFKFPHLKSVIEYIHKHSGEWNLEFAHWIYGHLFGYGEDEIGRFVKKQLESA